MCPVSARASASAWRARLISGSAWCCAWRAASVAASRSRRPPAAAPPAAAPRPHACAGAGLSRPAGGWRAGGGGGIAGGVVVAAGAVLAAELAGAAQAGRRQRATASGSLAGARRAAGHAWGLVGRHGRRLPVVSFPPDEKRKEKK